MSRDGIAVTSDSTGQTQLFVPCEICRKTVNYGTLAYAVGRDKWACQPCWSVWYA